MFHIDDMSVTRGAQADVWGLRLPATVLINLHRDAAHGRAHRCKWVRMHAENYEMQCMRSWTSVVFPEEFLPQLIYIYIYIRTLLYVLSFS